MMWCSFCIFLILVKLYSAGPLPQTADRMLLTLLEFLKNSNWRNQMFLIKRASDFSNLASLVEVVSSKNFSKTLTMNSDEILFLLKNSRAIWFLRYWRIPTVETRWLWNSPRPCLLSTPLTKFRPENLKDSKIIASIFTLCSNFVAFHFWCF